MLYTIILVIQTVLALYFLVVFNLTKEFEKKVEAGIQAVIFIVICIYLSQSAVSSQLLDSVNTLTIQTIVGDSMHHSEGL